MRRNAANERHDLAAFGTKSVAVEGHVDVRATHRRRAHVDQRSCGRTRCCRPTVSELVAVLAFVPRRPASGRYRSEVVGWSRRSVCDGDAMAPIHPDKQPRRQGLNMRQCRNMANPVTLLNNTSARRESRSPLGPRRNL